jgi:hypothetical protein
MTVWSWDRVFNAPVRDVIFPNVVFTVDKLANVCVEGIFDIEPGKPWESSGKTTALEVPERNQHGRPSRAPDYGEPRRLRR